MERDKAKSDKFAIYRMADAPPYAELDVMVTEHLTPIISDGLQRAGMAGADNGTIVKLLFAMPGMSLTYAWFKSGFPLPRHSHDADCLYYIIAGNLRLGTETLGAGDGFFVGSEVPYAYTPGEQGVELLEFRTAEQFNIRWLAHNKGFWDKTVGAIAAQQSQWQGERPPSSL